MTSNRIYGKFFGVYLLCSMCPTARKKTYIGFTVDPIKRLKQHNGGIYQGGAKKTNNGRPWEMILIIHGFPNQHTALRFEWAWQNPFISRRLRNLLNKKNATNSLDFELQILKLMLNTAPWNRLSLNIKWTSKFQIPRKFQDIFNRHRQELLEYEQEYLITIPKVCLSSTCIICDNSCLNGCSKYWGCLNKDCNGSFHISCLATLFTHRENEVIPICGFCPKCGIKMIWTDLVSSYE